MDTELDISKPVAPEDIARGDYVTVTHAVCEFVAWWRTESWQGDQPQRVTFMSPQAGRPLKVQAVCVPFVLVKTPEGQHRTVDVRRVRLVRLSPAFGKRAFKALREQHKAVSGT